MRTVPLRALFCSVIALCLGSCAVAQEPAGKPTSPSFTESTESSETTTGPNLERLIRPAFETESDFETAPDIESTANLTTAPNIGRLKDIVHVALTTNPAIAKARAKREALTGKRIQAGLGPNPKAGFFKKSCAATNSHFKKSCAATNSHFLKTSSMLRFPPSPGKLRFWNNASKRTCKIVFTKSY